MEKIGLKLVECFSGVGFQRMGIENTDIFDVESVNTCEMDTNAIISYAAIHCGLTKEMVNNYQEYPTRIAMANDLAKKHIGYDFLKKKEYDWQKVARSKDSKELLKTAWLADKLSKNVGDIELVEKFPTCNLLTFSYPCFTADTKIKTPQGLKNINQFNIGDFVDIAGKYYEVLSVFDQGVKTVGDLYFEDGYMVSCTPNHKFLVEKDITKRIWVAAEDLTNSDKIVSDYGYTYKTKYIHFRQEHVYDIQIDDIHCILQNMKEEDNLPTFLLMENVDALVNKKNLPQYEKLNEEFSELGYDVKWEVINGKNCGVPQNRKRVFAVYWLRDRVDLSDMDFPKPFDTGLRLKDVLLEEVDEKYYIKNDKAKALIEDLVVNGKVVLDEESSDHA